MTKINRVLQKKKQNGSTLLEAVVMVGVFSLITMLFVQTFSLALVYIVDARARLGALAVAKEQIEVLRNLAYDDIAIIGGVPSGLIVPDKEVILGRTTFRVQTDIRYIDDDFDGMIDDVPADVIPNDYKEAKVDVTWGAVSDIHRVHLSSLFVPPGIETTSGGGTLVINVVDAEGVALSGATVSVANTTVSPTINVSAFSDASGRVLMPGAPEATDYEITVIKDGYETVVTYPEYPVALFYPNERHASVTAAALTTQSVIAGALSTVTLTTKDPFDNPLSAVDITLSGGRMLGTDVLGETVYSINESITSGGDGTAYFAEHPPGLYTVTSDDVGYTLFDVDDTATVEPNIYGLAQGVSQVVDITLMDNTAPSLVVEVVDTITGASIIGADVRVEQVTLSYSALGTSNNYGKIFFPLALSEPLLQGQTYTVTATAQGYSEETTPINIQALETVKIALTAS